jgi:spore germination protein (amino acid permease)
MKDKVLVGHSEIAALFAIILGTKAFMGYPRLVTQLGLTAGWMIVLFGGLISLGLWLMIMGLMAKFPGKSLTFIAEDTFGSILGTGLNILMFLYILFTTSNLLRLLAEGVIFTALRETPVSALTVLFILMAWIGAYYGIEGIARTAYIAFPFITLGVAFALLSLYTYYDIRQLLPIFGSGILPVAKNSVIQTSAFGEIIFIAYFIKYFSFDAQKLRNTGIFSISFVTIFFMAVVVVYLMVFPVPVSNEALSPFYQLSRTIFLGYYFQRVEAVFVLFWNFSSFILLSASLLISATILQDTLKLPYYRPLLPALCLLVLSLALTPKNLMQAISLEGEIRMTYGSLFTFVLPLVILFVALIRRKRGVNSNAT